MKKLKRILLDIKHAPGDTFVVLVLLMMLRRGWSH
jgi:hypothetical protein